MGLDGLNVVYGWLEGRTSRLCSLKSASNFDWRSYGATLVSFYVLPPVLLHEGQISTIAVCLSKIADMPLCCDFLLCGLAAFQEPFPFKLDSSESSGWVETAFSNVRLVSFNLRGPIMPQTTPVVVQHRHACMCEAPALCCIHILQKQQHN